MWSSVFWAIRLTILTISSFLCVYTIWIAIKHKLTNRIPMKYAMLIAACQLVMGIFATIFAICSISINSGKQVSEGDYCKITTGSAHQDLAQVQAFFFKSSELISLSLTALLTIIIYDAIRDVDIHKYQRKARLLCFILPCILMSLMSGLNINGLCCVQFNFPEDYVYLNNVCRSSENEVGFEILWVVPCILLGLVTLVYVVLIYLEKRKTQDNMDMGNNDMDKELALIIYKIPLFSFIVYIFDLILTSKWIQWNQTGESAIVQSIPFWMPVVNVITVLTYKKHLLKYKTNSRLLR